MPELLMTSDGKKVRICRKTDLCLYDAQNNPPNTGTNYTRGTDLYAHKARSGKWYYYFYSWSMWQGESEGYRLCDEDEAKEFVLDAATYTLPSELSEREIERAKELWGDDFFEEDA